MKYKIRVQVVEYSDDTQRDEYKRDLLSFARIARIEPLKELMMPGMDCFEVDLDALPEHIQLGLERSGRLTFCCHFTNPSVP